MTKKFKVQIQEVLTYYIDVEAETPEQAEEKAYESEEFTQNMHQDNDSKVVGVHEVTS